MIDTFKPEIIKRLKRAEGQLKSIVIMLEEERGCLDIAQQLQAVEKAIANAKKALVHDHTSTAALSTPSARNRVTRTTPSPRSK